MPLAYPLRASRQAYDRPVSGAPSQGEPGENLAVRVDRRESTAVVHVAGDLDIATRPRLETRIDEILRGGIALLVLDCRELDFADSASIGLLYRLADRAATDGFGLAVVRGHAVGRLLEITGLD